MLSQDNLIEFTTFLIDSSNNLIEKYKDNQVDFENYDQIQESIGNWEIKNVGEKEYPNNKNE